MSSNNSTNGSMYDKVDWNALKISYYTMYSLTIFFGALFNSWMLAAIVTSPEMRLVMRNKLICVMLFNNLIRTVIASLFELIEVALIYEGTFRVPCSFGAFGRVIRFTLMWVENWYVLIFMVHYISTQLEFDPVKYLSAKKIQIGTWLILVGPWVVSFIVGPSVLAYHHNKTYGGKYKGCVYYSMSAFKVLNNFGIAAPWFLKFGLLVVILILNYRRKTRYTTMSASPTGPSTHIDDVKAYVVLYVIVAVTQLLVVVRILNRFRLSDFNSHFIYIFVVHYLSEFRSVIIPAAFLCFEDIRNRMKTWRPWYRPAPGIDLTVQYN